MFDTKDRQVVLAEGGQAICSNSVTYTAFTAAAGDAIGSDAAESQAMALEEAARIEGGGGYIVSARVRFTEAVTSVLRLWFFRTQVATMDPGEVFSLADIDIDDVIGYIDMPAMTPEAADEGWAFNCEARLPFKCAADSRNIYCIAEVVTTDLTLTGGSKDMHVSINIERS
jgi:hypothetical protein